MRISDWSSDVCSSDLRAQIRRVPVLHRDLAAGEVHVLRCTTERIARGVAFVAVTQTLHQVGTTVPLRRLGRIRLELAFPELPRAPCLQAVAHAVREIGSASCRERVCQYV